MAKFKSKIKKEANPNKGKAEEKKSEEKS